MRRRNTARNIINIENHSQLKALRLLLANMPDSPYMSRCECHETSFDEIAKVAEREPSLNFDDLCERAGFGQVCTACHRDAVCLLSRAGLCPKGAPKEDLEGDIPDAA